MQARIQALQKQVEKLCSDYKFCALRIIQGKKKPLTYETPFVYHWPNFFYHTITEGKLTHLLLPNDVQPKHPEIYLFLTKQDGRGVNCNIPSCDMQDSN